MNKRTAMILRAIIDEYVNTAEPVGSKTIVSKYDFGISSATIRNEMAELEQSGFINQPHTSAGRVPSEKGYRFYVDSMISEIDQIKYLDDIINKILIVIEMDKAIERISQMLSNRTEYASVGLIKQEKKNSVAAVHILSLNENEYVLVIILENRKVTHKIIRVERDEEIKIDLISGYINDKVVKKTASEIQGMDFDLIEIFNDKNKSFIKKVINEIISTIRENDSYTCFVKGHEKLLGYPEFKDASDVKEVIETLNRKEELLEVFTNSEGFKISIGSENPLSQLSKVSIASRTIDLGDLGHVTLGIAGPIRMNYRKVILSFTEIGKMLDSLIKEF